jgi:large subunit ribosomal protein L22
MVRASLHNYRQSPRKVRLVADFVRGKSVPQALSTLAFLSKRAAGPVQSVIEMAVASAEHDHKLNPAELMVKEIRVDEGKAMKRSLPRARGSASPIKKRMSHIAVVLDTAKAKK